MEDFTLHPSIFGGGGGICYFFDLSFAPTKMSDESESEWSHFQANY